MADTYWQDPTGLVWFVQSGGSPQPGWTQITQAEYVDSVVARELVQAEVDATIDALGDCAARKAAYVDLSASVHTKDWDESTIRYVARYTPGEC